MALEEATPAARSAVLILAVDAAVILLHVLNRLTDAEIRLFDLELEQNLPTWVSSIQFFGVALCAILLSRNAAGIQRAAWQLFAGIFLFFSLDELALLHEELVDRIATDPSGDSALWAVFYIPLGLGALISLVLVVGEARRAGGSTALLAGGLALLGGAVVLDSALALDAVATRLGDGFLFELGLVFEEAFELSGTAALIGALLAVLLDSREAPGSR